jgi:hypothetical protein
VIKQRGAPADDEPAEHVAADRVGAQPVLSALGPASESGENAIGAVRRDLRAEDGHHQHGQQHRDAQAEQQPATGLGAASAHR